MRSLLTVLALLPVVGCGDNISPPSPPSPPGSGEPPTVPTLVGRAILPAATFAPGPTSGTRLRPGPINGQPVPFIDKQPVQGFSGLVDNGDGTFLGMPDNGFGGIENSADFLLRAYTLRPNLKTAAGGAGTIDVLGFIQLRDPDRKIPFTITNERTAERYLTGADFDPESIQRAADGSLWLGDEFGPFLLHFDATGALLAPPVPLPDFAAGGGAEIRSSQNPFNEEASAIRIMNAVGAGAQRRPAIAPWHRMLADGDPTTFVPSRQAPPPGSGLAAASSEIFDVAALHAAGYPVVAWTVNNPARMRALLALHVDGIASGRPDLLYQEIAAYDANGDGAAGDYLDADGLIDPAKIDARGHRGARELRPENTLPAMEAALDHLMTTLDLDVGLAQDGVPILGSDPHVQSASCRCADGAAYGAADEILIRSLPAAQLQQRFICDKTARGGQQQNDPALSPVAVAFRAAHPSLPHVYAMPTLPQVLEFADFYAAYYRDGAGARHPDAARRWKNAARVRFGIELKTEPRPDRADRTDPPALFARAVGEAVAARGLAARADVQSFDFRGLLLAQELFPAIRTVYLLTDGDGGAGEESNLAPLGDRSPWLAGLWWPYRVTQLTHPFRAQRSGGFEGTAISPDRTRLYPILEQTLTGDAPQQLRIFEFDLAAERYVGERATYAVEARDTSVRDFLLFAPDRGLVVEIDKTEGDLRGFKRIFQITLPATPGPVIKEQVVDLMVIADPAGISLPGEPGDIGLGDPFAFPFETTESLVLLDGRRLATIDDNNFPGGVSRHPGRADDSELIVIDLGRELF